MTKEEKSDRMDRLMTRFKRMSVFASKAIEYNDLSMSFLIAFRLVSIGVDMNTLASQPTT